mgnify:CR=1 FL=1
MCLTFSIFDPLRIQRISTTIWWRCGYRRKSKTTAIVSDCIESILSWCTLSAGFEFFSLCVLLCLTRWSCWAKVLSHSAIEPWILQHSPAVIGEISCVYLVCLGKKKLSDLHRTHVLKLRPAARVSISVCSAFLFAWGIRSMYSKWMILPLCERWQCVFADLFVDSFPYGNASIGIPPWWRQSVLLKPDVVSPVTHWHWV